MAYNYPYGNGQQLNLDWFLNEWKNLLAAWEAEKNGIEGALQAEIDRAEAALADVFAARDAAAQSAANALESKNAAAQSAEDASGYLATVRADANTAHNAAQNAAQSESNAAESAQTALASKNTAANSERNAAQSEANANSSKNAAAQSAADALAHKDAAAQSAADALANKNAAAQSAEDASDAAASVEASSQQIATNTSDIADLKESVTQLENTAVGIVKDTGAVSVATFDDNIADSKVKKLAVNIEPAQTGSGDPKPTNIRPIAGWTSGNIYHSGEDTSNPEIIPITFPSEAGTVYGANLIINEDGSGIFTVKAVKENITSFYGAFGAVDNGFAVYTYNTLHTHIIPPEDRIFLKANTFTYTNINRNTAPPLTYGCNDGATPVYVFILPSTITSLEEANDWLANNPIEATFYLATPITYTLTEQEVITLLNGQNNIWANTGNINVTYYANSKAYIEEQNTLIKSLIAPTLDNMFADTALVVNDFRIVNNTLYRVTSPISAGGALTVDTNVVETNVADILKTLIN